MADPTKKRLLTPEEIKRCETYYGLGLTIQDMAALIGIGKATFERRMSDQPSLAEALLKGKAMADAQVTQSLFKQATSGKHPASTMFWLKCRKGWKDTPEDREEKAYKTPKTLKEDPES